jgi:outer membrane protein OmpA-like peptidoglycan-associated protein
MTRFRGRTLLLLIAVLLVESFTLSNPVAAQTGSMRVAFGAHGGASKYWGTFTDNQIWFGGDAFLRWNIIPYISFHALFGVGQLRYKIDDETVRNFPAYFGTVESAFYPGTANPPIARTEKAFINYRTYSGIFSYNITPNQRFIPYLFAGIGILNFEPENQADVALPNNYNDVYDDIQTKVYVPVGLGLEFYATEDLVINFKGQLHLTGTDWLDDLAEEGTSNDVFALFGAGLSYYIFGALDCDKDGLTDTEEKRIGTDPCNPDTDNDQLTDFDEVRVHGTDPLKVDSEDDGLGDYAELRQHMTDPRNADSDNDGLRDGEEVNARRTDPKNPDSDGDSLTDGDEVLRHNTDPTKTDTDGDGLDDGAEIKVHATNALAADTDSDGLNDGPELNQYKTNAKAADTDNDGLRDGDEITKVKSDPNDPDTDNDKLTDGEEVVRVKTDPLRPDTDGDTVIDGDDQCPLIVGVAERNGCPAPPKVGTITNFPAIYFVVNTDQFDFSRPETDESLAKMLAYVNQCPGLGVIIEGHASREGTEKRNQELSDLRAKKVKDWLIERGIEPSKVEATFGYGSRQNAVPEPDPKSKEARAMDPVQLEEIRKQNRRIAVRVVRTCD